ncbi:hypothetical protein STEG23_008416, partial [Scotinomys teguina]
TLLGSLACIVTSLYEPNLRRWLDLESPFLMTEGRKKRRTKVPALTWWRLYLLTSYWPIKTTWPYSNLI